MEYKSEATGARIVINPCSFVEARKLQSTIQKALLEQKLNLEQLWDSDLMTVIFALDSSEELFDALFTCLKKSQYNDIAIKPEVFDDVKAREDLYEILFNCIKLNIYPFLKTILSKLGIQQFLDKLKGDPKLLLKTTSDSSAALSQSKGISEETQKE